MNEHKRISELLAYAIQEMDSATNRSVYSDARNNVKILEQLLDIIA